MNVSSEITSKTSKNSHDNLDHNNFKSFIIAHKRPSGRDASSLPKYLGVIPPWRSKVWLLTLASGGGAPRAPPPVGIGPPFLCGLR